MTTLTLHGVIIINKSAQVTSQTVVKQVKKMLRVRKAGHTGTLDPFATGVLPVCLNEGTKLAPFLIDAEKEYEGVLRLGIETDTQDRTGTVIREQDPGTVSREDIVRAFGAFQGPIRQIPPMYSAVKHNGIPLYALARQGIEVKREAREVTIVELTLLGIEPPLVSFRVVCSKGTYIRTLVNDIGAYLTCGATLEELIRTRSGRFRMEDALDVNTLKGMSLEEAAHRVIAPAEALDRYPAIVVGDEVARKVQQGSVVTAQGLGELSAGLQEGQKVKILDEEGVLLAVAEMLSRTACEEDEARKPVWRLLRVFLLPGRKSLHKEPKEK